MKKYYVYYREDGEWRRTEPMTWPEAIHLLIFNEKDLITIESTDLGTEGTGTLEAAREGL